MRRWILPCVTLLLLWGLVEAGDRGFFQRIGTTLSPLNTGDSIAVTDDACQKFGTDTDFQICYDSGDNRLELLNSAGTVLSYMDGSGNWTFTGSATIEATSVSKIRVVEKTAATYTLGTDSTYDSRGTYFINADDDAIAFTLETASAGYAACFENKSGVSSAITVTPGAGDYLVKQGTRGTAATAYTSSGALGDKLCVLCIDDTDYQITVEVGVWSE